MDGKTILVVGLFLLLIMAMTGKCQDIVVPAQYPYPAELPQNGPTPAATIKVTAPMNPVAYSDRRPLVWDVFTGGGFRCVSTARERNNINEGYRKEGMLVWVKEDNHIWQLMDNLIEWNDLGEFGPKTYHQPLNTVPLIFQGIGCAVVIILVVVWTTYPLCLFQKIKQLKKELNQARSI